jgi:putative addiction module killer protein
VDVATRPDGAGSSPFGRIVQPPRTGRTVIAAHLVGRSRLTATFIVPTRTLVAQTAREFPKHLPGTPVGVFAGEEGAVVDDGVNAITYAMLGSARERVDILSPLGYTCTIFTVRLTEKFQDWLDGLHDKRLQLRVTARLRQAELGNLGDHKSLGAQLFELRLELGPGYRLHYTRRGNILIVMLVGGDKSTQTRDIARAKRMALRLE